LVKALDAAYRAYCKREAHFANGVNGTKGTNGVNGHVNGNGTAESAAAKSSLDRFDYLSFHAPNCKLVAKSYGRLLYHDYLADPDNQAFAEVPAELRDMDYEKSLTDKAVEKTFMGLTKKRFQERVNPGIQVATNVGNMYCASVYGGLAGLISNVDDAALQGKRIAMFSYGSGLAASFFSFRVVGSTEKIRKVLDISSRLAARRAVPPETYDAVSSEGEASGRRELDTC
jgi:hydroxymethylglutaryl-CoA synthase